MFGNHQLLERKLRESGRSTLATVSSEAAWQVADRENMRLRRIARAAARGQDPARTAAMEEMRRAAATDPEGFRELMRQRGPAAFGLPGAPGAPGSPAVVTTTGEDPPDRLSKLADLRDRGALTDAEFEAQKKKLLGD
jgi:uncharacterized phage protein gp47/JayE